MHTFMIYNNFNKEIGKFSIKQTCIKTRYDRVILAHNNFFGATIRIEVSVYTVLLCVYKIDTGTALFTCLLNEVGVTIHCNFSSRLITLNITALVNLRMLETTRRT